MIYRSLTGDGRAFFYNQLQNVTDTVTLPHGFVDVQNNTDYEYDYNGNMTADNNKNIQVEYNYLNLPAKVTMEGTGNYIEYVYNAAGVKLSKTVYSNNVESAVTDYVGAVEYVNGIFSQLHTQEGRITKTGNNYHYEYFLKDHLGNNRIAFGIDTTNGAAIILQENDYYAFGGRINKGLNNDNKYLYNGKELQEELDWLDYGWRMYDPAIARWNAVDPEAENYFRWSPYNYCLNNPIYYIDPDGRKVILNFENDKAKDEYVNTVNNGLEGQYTAKLKERKDGSYKLKFKKAKGGSYDNLTEQGKGFYDGMSSAINDKAVVNMDVMWDDPNTHVGSYMNNTLDMKDVQQGQPSGPDYVSGTGITQTGLIVHETVEQLEKAKRGLGKGDFDMASYKADHQVALKADEKVNLLTRQLEVPGIRQGEVDIYHRTTAGNQVAKYPAYPPTTIRVGTDPKRTVTITHTIPAQRIK